LNGDPSSLSTAKLCDPDVPVQLIVSDVHGLVQVALPAAVLAPSMNTAACFVEGEM
jgi:hypothetical protein